ncbi:MAG TPA: CBS domain-containing protein [Polyangiaceae bacterium]
MKIGKVMSRRVRTCLVSDDANTATQTMWENDCGFLPVVDSEGRLCGVVTDRDLLMGAYTQGRALRDMTVGSVMSRNVHTCASDDDVWHVERLMRSAQIRRVPVVGPEGSLVGIVSLGDLARSSQSSAAKKALEGLALAKTLSAICQPRPHGRAIAAE